MLVEVHLAVEGDETLFRTLAPDVFDRPVQPDLLSAFLRDPRHHMIYALSGRTLVGFVSAVHYLHPDKPAQLWINQISVTPMMQRQKIGSRLIRRLLDHGAVLDCTEAWALAETERTADFYAALGGRQSGCGAGLFTFPIGNPASPL